MDDFAMGDHVCSDHTIEVGQFGIPKLYSRTLSMAGLVNFSSLAVAFFTSLSHGYG